MLYLSMVCKYHSSGSFTPGQARGTLFRIAHWAILHHIARSMTRFRASANLHAQALGCDLSEGVTLQGDPNNNLLTATDSDSDISFTYDERSDRLAQASTVNNKTVPDVDIFYSYDDNDNITSVYDSVTGADQIFYGYDESNRLIRIGRSSTDPSSIRFSYNKLDNRTGTIYPNGVTSSYLYTPGKPNRLRTLTHSLTTTPLNEDGTSGETTIETHSSFVYSYNLNDYVTGVDTVRSELTVNSHLTYIYDTDNQLTSATKPQGTGTETFTYDLSGNRLRRDEEMKRPWIPHSQITMN